MSPTVLNIAVGRTVLEDGAKLNASQGPAGADARVKPQRRVKMSSVDAAFVALHICGMMQWTG